MEISGKHIVVFGLGITGVAVARFLIKRGARVTVTDKAEKERLAPDALNLRELGAAMELGEPRIKTLETADLIVLSPGVPHTLDPIQAARKRGVPVIGEIELASRFISDPIIAVTGTNGKTTVTTLLGEMLKSSGMDVFVGGNIGSPLIGYPDSGQRADRLVVELSSFQLDTIESFRPEGAVLLNITEDHMDRYPDFKAYADSKARVFLNQQDTDFAVLNGTDPAIWAMAEKIRSRKLFFSHVRLTGENAKDGAVIKPDRLDFYMGGENSWNLSLSQFTPPGPHNRENAAAASLAALAAGATREGITEALKNFKALSHRLETAGTVNGAVYINDSKATNVDAAVKAICTYDSPLVLIMGGRDKESDFSPLIPMIQNRVKTLILMGEAAKMINHVLGGIVDTRMVSDMADAVKAASQAACAGDVVLLAPACASFDQYADYKARGEDFRRTVQELKAKESQ